MTKTGYCTVCNDPLPTSSRSDRKFCKPCLAERARKRACDWAKENRLRHNENAKRTRSANPQKRLYLGAVYRSKQKHIPLNISLDDIVIPERCPILGCPLISGTQYAPSLDRIDPALGYVKGNVQVISYKANAMKQDATYEELERFANWVKTFQH